MYKKSNMLEASTTVEANHNVFLCMGFWWDKEIKTLKVENRDESPLNNTILLLNRWDGKLGFIGGKADKTNTTKAIIKVTYKEFQEYILTDLLREVKEEVGIDYIPSDELEHLITFRQGKTFNHLYFKHFDTSNEDIERMLSDIAFSTLDNGEVKGYNLLKFNKYNKNDSIISPLKNIKKSKFAGSTKQEINYIYKNYFKKRGV